MVIFHSYVNVYQRVSMLFHDQKHRSSWFLNNPHNLVAEHIYTSYLKNPPYCSYPKSSINRMDEILHQQFGMVETSWNPIDRINLPPFSTGDFAGPSTELIPMFWFLKSSIKHQSLVISRDIHIIYHYNSYDRTIINYIFDITHHSSFISVNIHT